MPLYTNDRRSLIPQKGEEAGLATKSVAPIATRETPAPLPSYVLLSEEETLKKREAFLKDPEAIAGIDKFAKLMGSHKDAEEYFAKVILNQKYDIK